MATCGRNSAPVSRGSAVVSALIVTGIKGFERSLEVFPEDGLRVRPSRQHAGVNRRGPATPLRGSSKFLHVANPVRPPAGHNHDTRLCAVLPEEKVASPQRSCRNHPEDSWHVDSPDPLRDIGMRACKALGIRRKKNLPGLLFTSACDGRNSEKTRRCDEIRKKFEPVWLFAHERDRKQYQIACEISSMVRVGDELAHSLPVIGPARMTPQAISAHRPPPTRMTKS